ncbi:MAG: D-fructose-6-phosphate amidotransferase [Rhodospirillaceae bacterium]|nr:D-fructose-6-phosphate amidotransferase [Rhodospirillaceae bacterium]|tara:strand:+ start:442 stop:741 length:300 start_codon:yes stop_codon:yes gene_type:complete
MEKNAIYLVLDVDIHNLEEYKKYIELGQPLVHKFGGEYIVRGGNIERSETELWEPKRMVIIKFPDKECAFNWYNSEEYKSIKSLRTNNSTSTLLFIDGV